MKATPLTVHTRKNKAYALTAGDCGGVLAIRSLTPGVFCDDINNNVMVISATSPARYNDEIHHSQFVSQTYAGRSKDKLPFVFTFKNTNEPVTHAVTIKQPLTCRDDKLPELRSTLQQEGMTLTEVPLSASLTWHFISRSPDPDGARALLNNERGQEYLKSVLTVRLHATPLPPYASWTGEPILTTPLAQQEELADVQY